MGTLAGRTPRGPVQLYVCRGPSTGSKRYQRASAGVSMLPQGRGAIYDWEHRSQADDQIWNQREL